VVNEDLTPEFLLSLGRAIGTFFGPGEVALGTDPRTSRDMVKNATMGGLLASGCSPMDLGILPTPAIQYFIKNGAYRGGVVITASHNPAEYNGIKCIDARGMELAREEEERIEALYLNRQFAAPGWSDLKTVHKRDAIPGYLRGIQAQVDLEAIRRRKLTVIVDCANGAGCTTTPYLVRDLGCTVITLNGHPDGTFPAHPSEPTEEHLGQLKEVVRSTGADLGLAHDGDADRCIFVDERGRFVPGDRTLALVANRVIREKKGGVVVTPISSSSCVEDMVKAAGGRLEYTRVGAPIVARTMYHIGATFGGEENGGMIFPEHQFCRDGGMTAAKVLEILAKEERGLSDLIAEVPIYFVVKETVRVPSERKDQAMAAILKSLEGVPYSAIDGVRIRKEEGWVLIRPSGTESIFRVYAEGATQEQANTLQRWGQELLRKALAP